MQISSKKKDIYIHTNTDTKVKWKKYEEKNRFLVDHPWAKEEKNCSKAASSGMKTAEKNSYSQSVSQSVDLCVWQRTTQKKLMKWESIALMPRENLSASHWKNNFFAA